MQRRYFLKCGLAGAGAIGLAGWMLPGLDRGWSGQALTDGGRAIFKALAPAVLACPYPVNSCFVVAGGATHSPALLLRWRPPDPHLLLGRRTFMHSVVTSAAAFDEAIEGWKGAPQTIYSDHFLETDPIDGANGFKLEAPPLYPVLSALSLPGFGAEHGKLMTEFPLTQALLALLRAGLQSGSTGGTVRLRGDGSAELYYPLDDAIWDGTRRALLAMAEIQFAAGARHVLPMHEFARPSIPAGSKPARQSPCC